MIVISDCSKDIVIPAGLGDNPGVVYDVAGVKSLNGETGDLKIKTVNGNDMLGDGNIEIKGGVETVNGETGNVKIKTVNGQSLMGEGDVPVDVGVETLNGQKGDLKIKSVNGAEMLGEGNVTIDTGVESLNGQKGALTLKTVNGNELTGDGNIEIKAGVESVNGETGNVIVKSLKYKEVNNTTKKEVYADVKAHWSNESGYTGDYVYYFMRNGDEILFSRFKINDYALIMTAVLPENIDLTINGEVVLVSCIVFSDESQNVEFRYNKFAIPTNVSQLTNDSNYQTKTEVDTAIENAVSGAGSDSVIVLDGLTQEERKAVYDKLDKSVPPKEVFKYNGAVSFYTYWGGSNYLKIFFLDETYGGGRVKQWSLDPEGWFGEEGIGMNYPNFLFFNVDNHTDEGADFECGYTGDYRYFLNSTWTSPNGYFLVLKKGIGDSTKFMVLPLTVLCDKEPDTTNIPIRIQFTANEKLYTYLHGDADGKWLFESAKPIGGVQSSEVSNIKVLTQAEYDALTTKDENVLYCIKG